MKLSLPQYPRRSIHTSIALLSKKSDWKKLGSSGFSFRTYTISMAVSFSVTFTTNRVEEDRSKCTSVFGKSLNAGEPNFRNLRYLSAKRSIIRRTLDFLPQMAQHILPYIMCRG